MIYIHKRSQVLYRFLLHAWDVETQEQHVIYVSVATGEVFSRSAIKFAENFDFVEDVQTAIQPREKTTLFEEKKNV